MTQATDLAARVAGLETECPCLVNGQPVCEQCAPPKNSTTQTILHWNGCLHCAGESSVPLFAWSRKTCVNCQGKGTLPIFLASGERDEVTDPTCYGLGWLPLDPGDMAQKAREDEGFREWLLQYAVSFNTSRGVAVWLIDLLCNNTAILRALLKMGKNA